MATFAIAPAEKNSPASDVVVTVEEFVQMDFEFPVELVNGRVEQMPPAAPHHGRVCINIGFPSKPGVV